MTDYFRTTCNAVVSESSDYSAPALNNNMEYASSGTLKAAKFAVTANNPVVTLDLGSFLTIKEVLVEVIGTVAVTVGFTAAGGAGTQVVAAGEWIKLTDVTVAGDMTFLTAAATSVCNVIVIGT